MRPSNVDFSVFDKVVVLLIVMCEIFIEVRTGWKADTCTSIRDTRARYLTSIERLWVSQEIEGSWNS